MVTMKLVLVFTLCIVNVACVYAATANCPEISRLSNQILGLHHRLFRRMQQTTKVLQSAVFQTKCIGKRCYMTEQSGQPPPPPPPSGKPCCPKDWQLIDRTCYFMSVKKATWYQAQMDCHSLNATLIRPDTPEKIKWLTDTSNNKKKNIWTDITDLGKEGVFVFFSTGKRILRTNFRKNEPNGKTRENCIQAVLGYSGLWNDAPCIGVYDSICERTEKNIWTDITDLGKEGVFVFFSTGKRILRTNFRKNEPNGKTRENCIQAVLGYSGLWNDAPCIGVYDSICERTEKNIWTDITDLGKEGVFVFFSTGKRILRTNFRKNEPNGKTRENCIQAVLGYSGLWNDAPCIGVYDSICERTADLC